MKNWLKDLDNQTRIKMRITGKPMLLAGLNDENQCLGFKVDNYGYEVFVLEWDSEFYYPPVRKYDKKIFDRFDNVDIDDVDERFNNMCDELAEKYKFNGENRPLPLFITRFINL